MSTVAWFVLRVSLDFGNLDGLNGSKRFGFATFTTNAITFLLENACLPR